MQPNSKIVDELVRRIVDGVHPLRIILFGSAARDEMSPDSDLDVLVVMPDGTHRRKTAQKIYRHLWGLGYAKDIVVVTESDVQQQRSNPYMIVKTALEEGREVYGAATDIEELKGLLHRQTQKTVSVDEMNRVIRKRAGGKP